MLTVRKSGTFVLIAAGVGFFTLGVAQSLASTNWQSSVQRTKLGDGSELTEYIAETEAVNSSEIRLRTTFIPRFACTPLTTIAILDQKHFPAFPSSSLTRALDFFIDGTPTAFPAVIDRSDSLAEAQFMGSLERRVKLRLLLDSGRIASLKTSEERWDFSLIGSRVIQNEAKANCRNHVSVN